ncbi:biotin-protein ligase [Phycomyces blakesleeanus]|uniref:Biotin-protein ligase n=1 Tax=Phycomyces blakesleeanus TaxID=4837 RepID=A0ABR3BD85_PHYBL
MRRYVAGGGRYLGLCAGAYYASQSIEFEKGTPMEITGPRELGFYPGISRGTMYPGFVYNSEKGARVVPIDLNTNSLSVKDYSGLPEGLKVYYNGGGYFVNAVEKEDVEVLAWYSEKGHSQEEKTAAAVLCHIGQGSAALMGIHPEYDVSTMDLSEAGKDTSFIQQLVISDQARKTFLCAVFSKMGLKTAGYETKGTTLEIKENTVPALTPIYLATLRAEVTKSIACSLLEKADTTTHILADVNDRFQLLPMEESSLSAQMSSLTLQNNANNTDEEKPLTQIVYSTNTDSDPKAPVFPSRSLTPSFNIQEYFASLSEKRSHEWGGGGWYRFGNSMLYSQVITSTQTVLDRNYTFSQSLPTEGALQFSLVVRHNLGLTKAPVVFIQYIIALAVVESIRTRDGYEGVPLRLKWPNDIYVDLPGPEGGLKKVGGLLVNSSFVKDEFLLVIGCGINLANPHPTVSINDVIQNHNPSLRRLSPEDTLSGIMVHFEKMYLEFCEKGMGSWFLDKYYQRWLHSNKLVTLTTHDDVRARITGITSDYGMLEAVSLEDSRKKFTLQPDGNSFDMLKGLIIKKA